MFAGVCALLFVTALQAQSWTPVGPDNKGGRIRALAFSPDGNKLFAGAAGGGLWVSTNLGQSWKPVDAYNLTAQGNQGITSMLTTSSAIYVATGPMMYHKDEFGSPYQVVANQQSQFPFMNTDGFLGDAEKPGAGVYVSTDGGATWSNNNATNPNGNMTSPYIAIQRIIKGANNRLLVATWKGLFYSDDNLATMQAVTGGDVASQPVFDVEAGADNVVFAGTADKLFRSTDNGATFSEIPVTTIGPASTALFAGSSVNIAISAQNRAKIYVTGVKSSGTIGGVYSSSDNGQTWSTIAPPEGAGFTPMANNIGAYACMFDVSPFDETKLYLAANVWYTYSAADGWVQTVQHSNPYVFVQFGGRPYLPTSIFCLAYHPTNSSMFFVGTEEGVFFTGDGGKQFADRSSGLEASIVYKVSTTGQDTLNGGLNGVYASLPDVGLMLNSSYAKTSDVPGLSNGQGFGLLSSVNANSDDGRAKGVIATSITHPGATIIQNTDYGLTRSLDFGNSFSTFYGTPAVSNELDLGLAAANTYNVRETPCDNSTSIIRVDNLTWIDRQNPCNEGGTLYANYRPEKNGTIQVIPFALTENLPDSVISDSVYFVTNAISGRDSLVSTIGWAKFGNDPANANTKYEKEILMQQDAFIFFCTRDYVWRVDNPFNNPPAQLPRWTRITNDLTGPGEFFTAIAAGNDANHTVYVGTNRGNLWQIRGAHNFDTFNGATDIRQLNVAADPNATFNIDAMAGYSVTDIAIDPKNPGRVAVSFRGGSADLLPVGGLYSYLWVSDSMQSSPFVPQFTNVSMSDENGNAIGDLQINAVAWVETPDQAAVRSVLMIGTDKGLFVSKDAGTDEFLGLDPMVPYATVTFTGELTSATAGFGNIPVTDIYVQRYKTAIISAETANYTALRDNTVFIATYGRGVWQNTSYRLGKREGVTPPTPSVAASSAWVYPNPVAGDKTTLRLNLAQETAANVTVFDITGKVCGTVVNTTLGAGKHAIEVPTGNLNAGVYMIEVQAGEFHQTLKMVVTK